jgi:ADP-ribose pyrophosphatase YjhB (NUDIX family)
VSRFNIRVYGICIHDGRLLVNDELIRGQRVIKFPGGGLELGEGTRDGLIREFKEELGIYIEVLDHYYTTDFYQPSAFDDSQVISIYYYIRLPVPSPALSNSIAGELTYWLPIPELDPSVFTLPIDKVVARMVVNDYFALPD